MPVMAAYPEGWFGDDDEEEEDGGSSKSSSRTSSSSDGDDNDDDDKEDDDSGNNNNQTQRAFVSVGLDRRVAWIEDGGAADGAPLRAFRRGPLLPAEPLCAAAAAGSSSLGQGGGLLAVGLSDGSVRLLDAAGGDEKECLAVVPAPWDDREEAPPAPERRGAERVCFLESGGGSGGAGEEGPPPLLLAVGYGDGAVRLWSLDGDGGGAYSPRMLAELFVRERTGEAEPRAHVVSALAAARLPPGEQQQQAFVLAAGDSGGALAAWSVSFALGVPCGPPLRLTPSPVFRPHARAVVDMFVVAAAAAEPAPAWSWPGTARPEDAEDEEEDDDDESPASASLALVASASLDGTARLFSVGGGSGRRKTRAVGALCCG
jgi:hypothetical protein